MTIDWPALYVMYVPRSHPHLWGQRFGGQNRLSRVNAPGANPWDLCLFGHVV